VDLKNAQAAAELRPHQHALPVQCQPLEAPDGGGDAAITVRVDDVPSLDELRAR
jgi:hypothetical protein